MSIDKTKTLKRLFIAVEKLHPHPLNPNRMSERQFNLLVDNIERMGVTDPVLVRPHPEIEGEYRIVGGQHRWEAAKLLGFTEIPCTVVEHEDFDADAEAFQIVRHNIIGGKMDPAKFGKLVDSLAGKYSDELTAELFGFADEAEFKKLVKSTEKSLPKELQAEFKEAAKELKTIDDLAKLLNVLFSTYGDTLPSGYMIFDYSGYESVWLRLQTNQLKNFRTLASEVRTSGKALDHVVASLIQHLVSEDGAELRLQLIANAPEVKVKDDAPYATLDFLDS